ncbi:MAG: hypothetical protein HY810_03655 [Candidatus Omnitrophica bacterium]|nr:hypothetical protein [Candidatus Omnitrophota bacterium]
MDRGKYGCWTLNLFIFVMLFSVPEAFADDLEKLLLELPQVEIIGKKDLDQRFVKEDIKPDDFKLDNVETESKKEDSNILVSSAYGQFNSEIFDLKQSLRTEQMYYSTELSISDSDGERDNSQFTSYRPRFSFELPVNKENEFIFDMNYFDKAMGLPGPVDAQTPASKRRNTSTKISSTLKHRQDDVCLTFTPYYWFSVLNDTAGPGYKDKLLGARGGVEYNENSLNIDIYQDRLDKNYERLRMLANFRLAALDLTDQWQLILGTDIFAEEEFGQRPAPFAEFVFVMKKTIYFISLPWSASLSRLFSAIYILTRITLK